MLALLELLTPELSSGHGNRPVHVAVSPVCSPLQGTLPPSQQPLRDSPLLRGQPRPAGSELLDKAAPARDGGTDADAATLDSLGAAAEAQAQAEASGFTSTEEADALEDITASGDRDEDGDRRGPLRSNILLMLRRRRRGGREKKEEEELPPMQVGPWGRAQLWQGLNHKRQARCGCHPQCWLARLSETATYQWGLGQEASPAACSSKQALQQ